MSDSSISIKNLYDFIKSRGVSFRRAKRAFSIDEEDYEESLPEFRASNKHAEKLIDIFIDRSKDNLSVPRIFIDGTFRLTRVAIGKKNINGRSVIAPFHVGQLVVSGLIFDEENVLRPLEIDTPIINLFIFVAPFKLLDINPIESGVIPKERVLDSTGEFKAKILDVIKKSRSESKLPLLVTDTSTLLREGSQNKIDENLLENPSSGRLVRRAGDRCKVLMRIIELIFYDLIVSEEKIKSYLENEDSFVLMDGPPVQLSKYLRLVDKRFKAMFDNVYARVNEIYDKFRFLSGITKHIRIFPDDLQEIIWGETILSYSEEFGNTAWVYWMPHVAKGVDEGKKITIGKLLLCVFMYLRPEIIENIKKTYPFLGITRFDVAIPSILELEEFKEYYTEKLTSWFDIETDEYNKQDDAEAIEYLKKKLKENEKQDKILKKLKGIRHLAYPLPPRAVSRVQRWTTELYPIYEVERLIKAHLFPTRKIEAIFSHSDISEKLIF